MVNEFSLTTMSKVKNFMGMSGSTSTTDDLLEDIINRVSILFESYMNENILSREYTETHDGKGVWVLFPKHSPITDITSIHDDYDWVFSDDDLIDADTYRIVDDQYITLKTTVNPFENLIQNIKIVYTAGYSSVPEDIEHAIITESARIYKNKNQVDITSKTLSDGSVSFYTKDLLPQTILTLNKYKRLQVV